MPWGLEFQPTLWPVKGLSHGCGRELSAGRRSGFPASCHGRDWAEIFGNHAATWIWLPSESLRQLNIDPEHKNYFLVDTHLLTPIWQGPWRVLSSLNICCCCFFYMGQSTINTEFTVFAICCSYFCCDSANPRQGSGLSSCRWVTFAGMTDLLYLVQLMKQELPETLCALALAPLARAKCRNWMGMENGMIVCYIVTI